MYISPAVQKLDRLILSELRLMLSDRLKFSSNSRKRGSAVEQFICNHFKKLGFDGFDLNQRHGKDCSHFEIKSVMCQTKNGNLVPKKTITIANKTIDKSRKFKDSNFYNKASLLLLVCVDEKCNVVDIRFSNFKVSELGLAYYGHSDLFYYTHTKIKFNKKYFTSHTVSIKDLINEDVRTFNNWIKHLDKSTEKSFSEWIKLL